jgi:hypothetical protein
LKPQEDWIQNNVSVNMPTLKDLTIEVLKNVSPSASLEEIMYKINLAAQVMEGIKDADQGKVISTDELLKRIDSWAK